MNRPFAVSLVLGALMLATGAATKTLTPTVKMADQQAALNLNQMVPQQFGDWRLDPDAMENVAPSPDVKVNLDKIYDQILSRTYVDSHGQRMMLTITYGSQQTQELRAHRQEVCYAAQGFDISALSHESIRLAGHDVPVTRMFAEKGERKEPVTYWFTMGDQVVLSRTERFMVQLKYSVAGIIPDGMLVRVSNLSTDRKAAFDAQRAFLDQLMASLDKSASVKLLGS